ncbi:MAG: ribulose-phosphate 3-epimerase [Clostridia bacterium]|nr:ribulose-phosphate 3-epimerase [Clostridia bacterium]
MSTSIISPSVMCMPAWKDSTGVIKDMAEGGVELLHADVMDGVFVPNLMLGTDSIKALRAVSPVPLDIHLMIESPEEKLAWFDIREGEYVSIHAESTRHLQKALSRVRDFGANPMVALNPATPIIMIEDVLDDVDGVLLMTVNPGFAGQKLIPQCLEKISRLRKMLDENGKEHIRIEVDGNVSFENAKRMRAAGADIFVGGTSSVFAKDGSVKSNLEKMWKSLKDGEELFYA